MIRVSFFFCYLYHSVLFFTQWVRYRKSLLSISLKTLTAVAHSGININFRQRLMLLNLGYSWSIYRKTQVYFLKGKNRTYMLPGSYFKNMLFTHFYYKSNVKSNN